MTKAEVVFWQHVRNRNFAYLKFRRQYRVGKFIVDFYCARYRLAVELDGSQHYTPEGIMYDTQRTVFLESQGIRVVRYSNSEVLNNLEAVFADLLVHCQGSGHSSAKRRRQ